MFSISWHTQFFDRAHHAASWDFTSPNGPCMTIPQTHVMHLQTICSAPVCHSTVAVVANHCLRATSVFVPAFDISESQSTLLC